MSFDLPPDSDGPQRGAPTISAPSGRGRALIITVLILVGILVAFFMFAGFYTDLLWYRSVGFTSVFTTELGTRIALFALFGLLMALGVGASLWIAYRTRPAFRGLSPEQQSLDRYRVAVDPYRRGILIAVMVALGLLAGGSAASQWRTWLLFRNAVPFKETDAQFGLDLSFFVFRLPFWRFLIGFGFAVVLLSLLGAVITHYLYGGLRLQSPGEKTTPAARNQIAILLGLFVLLKAAAYWTDRYELVVKDSGPDQRWQLHRHQRAAAGEDDPRSGSLWSVPCSSSRRCSPQLVPPVVGLGAAGPQRRDRRRDLPGRRAAVPGEAERAGQGGAVHPAQHRLHPSGLRPGPGGRPGVRRDRAADQGRAGGADRGTV